jgi:thiamine pyrophosphokinase
LVFQVKQFMSSHHFVRDKQEAALIIANGESCSSEILNQLLEWNPFVVVLDEAVYRVIQLGIKMDVVLGDFDRPNEVQELLKNYQPVEIICAPDQNRTDFEKGIDLLIERGYSAVNIIWATGLRSDHSISNITNIVRYHQKIQITLLDNHSKIYQLPKEFTKWYPKKSTISLIPVGKVDGIKTEGLKYNLNNESLTMGYRTGSSNETVEDGLIKITHTQGDLLMMECWD